MKMTLDSRNGTGLDGGKRQLSATANFWRRAVNTRHLAVRGQLEQAAAKDPAVEPANDQFSFDGRKRTNGNEDDSDD